MFLISFSSNPHTPWSSYKIITTTKYNEKKNEKVSRMPHALSFGDSATAWIRTRVTSATTRNTNHYTTVAEFAAGEFFTKREVYQIWPSKSLFLYESSWIITAVYNHWIGICSVGIGRYKMGLCNENKHPWPLFYLRWTRTVLKLWVQ